jgi:hypothetical protein
MKPSVYRGMSREALRKVLPTQFKDFPFTLEVREPLSAVVFRDEDTVDSGRLRRAVVKVGAEWPLLVIAQDFTLEACQLAEELGVDILARGLCQWSDELVKRTCVWTGTHVKKPEW